MAEEKTAQAAGSAAYFLHAASPSTGGSAVESPGPLPTYEFWANAIKVGGLYKHPTKGFQLAVSPERAERWMQNFSRFQQRGIRVPVCADHSVKARDTLGHVVEMKREGDWIRARFLVVGEDARAIAARNEVSLGINPRFVDGEGNDFAEAISHLAITPEPVVPSQHGTIAASREGSADEPVPDVFQLSAVACAADATPPPALERSKKPMDAELKKRLIASAGAAEDTTEDVLLSRVADEFDKMAADITALAAANEAAGEQIALSRESLTTAEKDRDAAKAEVVTLSRERDEAKAETLNLSRERAAPDAITLSMFVENIDARRELAVKSGAISEAEAKAADEFLADADGNPNVLALSLAGSDRKPFAFKFWDWVAKLGNNAVRTGNAVPRDVKKVVQLSREPGANGEGNQGPLPEPKYVELMSNAGHTVTHADYERYLQRKGATA